MKVVCGSERLIAPKIADIRLVTVAEAQLGGRLVVDLAAQLPEQQSFVEGRIKVSVVLEEVYRVQCRKPRWRGRNIDAVRASLNVAFVRAEDVDPVLYDRAAHAECGKSPLVVGTPERGWIVRFVRALKRIQLDQSGVLI